MSRRIAIAIAVAGACACGGTTPPAGDPTTIGASKTPGDADSRFGPLEVGADYESYRRVTDAPFLSTAHGDRWVHVWVNPVGADAYLDGSPMPDGSIVVKSSVEDAGGAPSDVEGPLYIMEKRPAGYATDHGDWYCAIHWAEPTPDQRQSLGGPIYWRGSSPRVEYCYDCHDAYDRGLGGLVPSSQLSR